VPPRSATGHAFTELARASATALGDGNHVLLVVGASAGPGTGVVASNLAAALARTRAETVLICADQHGSISPKLLGIGGGGARGLGDVLAGMVTINEVTLPSAAVPRLRVIAPGTDPGAVDDLQYDAGRRLIAALNESARYIVIDAGALPAGGTLGMAEFADASIVVAELDSTTRGEMAECVRRLDRIRTEVLGAAILPPTRWSDRKAKAATRSASAAETARPTRMDRVEPRPAPGGSRRPGGPPPPHGQAGGRPPAGPGGEPYGPGPVPDEFGRRSKHGPPNDAAAGSAPRNAGGQPWPLPRTARPDSGQPGGRPTADYPADYPTAKGKGES